VLFDNRAGDRQSKDHPARFRRIQRHHNLRNTAGLNAYASVTYMNIDGTISVIRHYRWRSTVRHRIDAVAN
jgi:hypothetical protein